MSKDILDLRRASPTNAKRWRCFECGELQEGDQYTLEHKSKEGSLFALMMCFDCAFKRMFRVKDLEKIKPKKSVCDKS